MDEDILELVSQYDQAFEADVVMEDDWDEEDERPRTADDGKEVVEHLLFNSSFANLSRRPQALGCVSEDRDVNSDEVTLLLIFCFEKLCSVMHQLK